MNSFIRVMYFQIKKIKQTVLIKSQKHLIHTGE